jgi:hypothetical protein
MFTIGIEKFKILLILLLYISLQPGTLVQAAFIDVNSTADSGPGTLRQALLDAVKGDTITFNSAVFPLISPSTITLTSAMLPSINQGQIAIDASSAGVIIDGESLSTGDGLHIASDSNTVKGLEIKYFIDGIRIADESCSNLIGGSHIGEPNIISGNRANGISIGGAGTGNAILSNSIFSNSNLGIDLGNDGATDNDPADADTGANNLQNFPEITSARIDVNGDLFINYHVDSDPGNSAYALTIQFFKSDTTGQGKFLIGEDSYTTNDFNKGGKIASLGNASVLGVAGFDSVVSTVTDDSGNTSEFSLFKLITDINIVLENNLPNAYDLYQNYPNPFNPSTTIEFDLPKTSEVTLKIFNILGEEVATLVSDRLTAGSYSYEWSRPAGIASSVYLYRLSVGSLSTKSGHSVAGEAGDFIETKKMVLMR